MNNYEFHPFEFAVCGFSNSGKTTLISKLIKELSCEYKVGYLKHDAHRFEMDKVGKDTWQAAESGADLVSINDANKECVIQNKINKNLFDSYKYLDCDLLIVEGYKNFNISKLVFVDDAGDIFNKIECEKSVKGFIISNSSQRDQIPAGLKSLPVFNRDDAASIKDFILKTCIERSANVPVYGLILAGGKSSRMKKDKPGMVYHGDKTQLEYLSDVLATKTSKTFISCRTDQKSIHPYSQFETIEDKFIGMGPLGGILSAMQTHPFAKWLVLACDLPLVNEDAITEILENEGQFKMATAFENHEGNRLEPLCALYSPWAYPRLLQMISIGRYCPQKFLWNAPIKKIPLKNVSWLSNANTPEDFHQIKNILGDSYDN